MFQTLKLNPLSHFQLALMTLAEMVQKMNLLRVLYLKIKKRFICCTVKNQFLKQSIKKLILGKQFTGKPYNQVRGNSSSQRY